MSRWKYTCNLRLATTACSCRSSGSVSLSR